MQHCGVTGRAFFGGGLVVEWSYPSRRPLDSKTLPAMDGSIPSTSNSLFTGELKEENLDLLMLFQREKGESPSRLF
jgi:hypothetical protein